VATSLTFRNNRLESTQFKSHTKGTPHFTSTQALSAISVQVLLRSVVSHRKASTLVKKLSKHTPIKT